MKTIKTVKFNLIFHKTKLINKKNYIHQEIPHLPLELYQLCLQEGLILNPKVTS